MYKVKAFLLFVPESWGLPGAGRPCRPGWGQKARRRSSSSHRWEPGQYYNRPRWNVVKCFNWQLNLIDSWSCGTICVALSRTGSSQRNWDWTIQVLFLTVVQENQLKIHIESEFFSQDWLRLILSPDFEETNPSRSGSRRRGHQEGTMLEEAKVKSPSAFKIALWLLSALNSQTEYQWIPPAWSRALGADTAV